MQDSPPTGGGVFASVAQLLKTLRDVAENRLQLFLVEWKEERARLFGALLLAAAAGIGALMTLVTLTLLVIVMFWETHRLLVLSLLTAAYAGATAAAIIVLRARLQRWQAFAATLEQLKKDRACWEKPK